jgi:CubicO group peptidase (beta-lactamase class C family)
MLRRDDAGLTTRIARVLGDWPASGLAVGVVRVGAPVWLHTHGVADVASGRPVTADTVFRVGSLTKTFTAVAVLQLWERGLVDLDAPANDYLRTFRLVPAGAGLGPATVRHLLTHAAGVGYWRRWSDLLHPGVGAGVSARSVPSLAEFYRRGLPVEVEPGTKWCYSNHGFAALGQLVEDVTGDPLDRYLRVHVFDPLGMERTALTRSPRVVATLATGYSLGSRGLRGVADREVPLAASGGAYSCIADMARYVAALLQGGGGEGDIVLQPATVAMMFAPQLQDDPRVPGMGLSFELGDEGGHRTATKSGTVAGFLSQVSLAPDDGVGVVALTNTGSLNGRGAPEILAGALLRHLLDLPDDPIRHDLPPHPEVWGELCGWYGMDPGPVTNLFGRLVFGAGIEVVVRDNRLWFRPLSAVPSMRAGFVLHPDAEDDPYVFRVDLQRVGMGSFRVAFRADVQGGRPATRCEGLGLSLRRRPDVRNPRRLLGAGLSTLAVGGGALLVRRGSRRRPAT